MSCQAIASDLYDFAELLVKHSLLQDARSLYGASSKLQTSQDSTKWSYECCDLKFFCEGTVAGTIPHQINLVEIIFSISLTGIFPDLTTNFKNPLLKLNFDIEIEGFRDDQDKIDNFFACWHLDKHIPSSFCSYIHPEYHLTFGGNRLEEKGVSIFGSTLILPSPRISYPPMDAILGIDFILQNYFPKRKIFKLLNDSKYKELISNSKYRLWKPYFLSLSSAWNDLPNTTFEQGFEFHNLNPHI